MTVDLRAKQENKFEVGDKVFEITRPQHVMVITERNGAVYYCYLLNDKSHTMAFMERDLKKDLKHHSSPQIPKKIRKPGAFGFLGW